MALKLTTPTPQATHLPKDSYNSLKYLLGVPASADIVSYYRTFAPPSIVPSTHFAATIPRRGSKQATMSWDIEELALPCPAAPDSSPMYRAALSHKIRRP